MTMYVIHYTLHHPEGDIPQATPPLTHAETARHLEWLTETASTTPTHIVETRTLTAAYPVSAFPQGD